MSEADCPDEVGEAEFARSSGRGLRRVNNFAQDAKGMCKKENNKGSVSRMGDELLNTIKIMHFPDNPRTPQPRGFPREI